MKLQTHGNIYGLKVTRDDYYGENVPLVSSVNSEQREREVFLIFSKVVLLKKKSSKGKHLATVKKTNKQYPDLSALKNKVTLAKQDVIFSLIKLDIQASTHA